MKEKQLKIYKPKYNWFNFSTHHITLLGSAYCSVTYGYTHFYDTQLDKHSFCSSSSL